ncbi:MAG: DUF4270 domain-containing protein [Muribaculaceae bacterium]|nr:DUF4270 domain-containing protein [Muribaculaceae bacterium]
MSKLITILLAILAILACACSETSPIGGSLAEDQLAIRVDSDFVIDGHSIALTSVRSRTTNQLLGAIEVPEYGTLRSSVVTQFLCATSLDTANFSAQNVDSIFLVMQFNPGSFIGDSIAPMGLKAYPLTRQLPTPIFSDFDPEGYYDPSRILAAGAYNTSTLESDSLRRLAVRSIRMKLPLELGRQLFTAYRNNPADYASGQTFSTNVFPGMYIESSFGSGRMTLVQKTSMRMYLRNIRPNDEGGLDTLNAQQDYYMVTPEVITNNNFDYTMAPSLKARADRGEALLVAPCGYEVEIKFPTREIINRYRQNSDALSVINSLSLSIPTDSIANSFGVGAPPYALLVRKDKRDEFFENYSLTDNISSFYATYSSETGTYNFGSMRAYIADMLKKDEITDDDCTFLIIPVTVNFESSANTSYYGSASLVESSIVPYVMSPAMVALKLNEAKIKFTYSLQSQK